MKEFTYSTNPKFYLRHPTEINFYRNIRYNVNIVFYFLKRKVVIFERIKMEWIRDLFEIFSYLLWKIQYLENLNFRLIKWPLIYGSIQESLVYSFFSTTKSFKRENISKISLPLFLSHKPNFPANAFIFSVTKIVSASFPCIPMFNVWNPKICLFKYTNLGTNVHGENCAACTMYII